MKLLDRNDICWCGSNKKYKKCHMESDLELVKYEREGYKIPNLRLIKTPEQIEGIRKSGKITKEILTKVKDLIQVGTTTNEINDFVHDYTISQGGTPAPLNYNGFPKSTCTSINEVICHGIPSDRKLLNGDIINIDVTTIFNGYYADSNRMYSVGEVSETAKNLIKVSKECLYLGMEAVKPYGDLNEVGRVIEEHAIKNGYSVVREYGGHGVGIKFHEDPHVDHFKKNNKGFLLLPGMVFTIEPMINEGTYHSKTLSDNWTAITVDGKLSSQWEHTICVTENGYEILT